MLFTMFMTLDTQSLSATKPTMEDLFCEEPDDSNFDLSDVDATAGIEPTNKITKLESQLNDLKQTVFEREKIVADLEVSIECNSTPKIAKLHIFRMNWTQ